VPDVPAALPYGTAVVLLAAVLLVNALSIAVRVRLRSRKKW
jgi:ABC-type phosphate transport system permease subunit